MYKIKVIFVYDLPIVPMFWFCSYERIAVLLIVLFCDKIFHIIFIITLDNRLRVFPSNFRLKFIAGEQPTYIDSIKAFLLKIKTLF